jgi:hypothetical protein
MYGIRQTALLPFEDRASYDALVADYYASFRPSRPEETLFVDEIIRAEWTLRRLRRTECELNSFVHQTCSQPHEDFPLGQPAFVNPKVFTALQWRINATRKARKDALAAFRELRDNPIPDVA